MLPYCSQSRGQQADPSSCGGGGRGVEGGLHPVLAGPRPAPVAAHGLGHDQPQQDQDPSPQGQAHHVAPGVIWKGQEGTVTGGPWEEPPRAPRPKESHGGNRGRKGMEGVQMGLPGQTPRKGDTLGSSWPNEGEREVQREPRGLLPPLSPTSLLPGDTFYPPVTPPSGTKDGEEDRNMEVALTCHCQPDGTARLQ